MLTLTLTEIEADVLREFLDQKLAENRRHSGPDSKPQIRTRVLQEIRERLGGPPHNKRPYTKRPSPIFKEKAI